MPHDFRIPDDSGKPAEGSTAVNITVKTEIDFLTHLTNHGCSSTPRLLDYSQVQQSEDMCHPGGYIVFILMEMLPGKMIMDFWDYDRETRDRIRESFKSSWLEVNKACVYHGDAGIRNLLWHEETGKCYILYFKDADFIDKPYPFWMDAEYVYWELLKTTLGVDEW